MLPLPSREYKFLASNRRRPMTLQCTKGMGCILQPRAQKLTSPTGMNPHAPWCLPVNSRWLSKWQRNDFWEKSPVDSADTLRVKNFVEIAPSHTVSEINTFLHFMQKFKMATKNGGKTILGKSHQ